VSPELRELLGRTVRLAWVSWAFEQTDVDQHPSWTVPWDGLSERDKEVDRRIGERLYEMGYFEGRVEALRLTEVPVQSAKEPVP
jgi:hypothetical protein